MREILNGFFVLEGIDGSGTTTQLKRIAERARAEAQPVRTDCEPTAHPIGVLIRSIFRHETDALPAVLAPLFAADRRQHLDGPGGIREAVATGTTVVSDRYFFSSMAYQSLDLPWEEVWKLNASFPLPEALFWFEVDVAEAQARIDRRGLARERYEDADTQHRVRESYHRAIEQAEAEGLEVVRLDASRSVEELAHAVWDRICR
jgi:dTMP kinase